MTARMCRTITAFRTACQFDVGPRCWLQQRRVEGAVLCTHSLVAMCHHTGCPKGALMPPCRAMRGTPPKRSITTPPPSAMLLVSGTETC
jgi:hypothetical protein